MDTQPTLFGGTATVQIEAPYGSWVVEFRIEEPVLGPQRALRMAQEAGHTGPVKQAKRLGSREWFLRLGDLRDEPAVRQATPTDPSVKFGPGGREDSAIWGP